MCVARHLLLATGGGGCSPVRSGARPPVPPIGLDVGRSAPFLRHVMGVVSGASVSSRGEGGGSASHALCVGRHARTGHVGGGGGGSFP